MEVCKIYIAINNPCQTLESAGSVKENITVHISKNYPVCRGSVSGQRNEPTPTGAPLTHNYHKS